MTTDNNETVKDSTVKPLPLKEATLLISPDVRAEYCDNSLDGPVRHEDWTKENLIKQLKKADSIIDGHNKEVNELKNNFERIQEKDAQTIEDCLERSKASVSSGYKLSEELEKIKSRTFDEWLKGLIEDQVDARLKKWTEESDMINLDRKIAAVMEEAVSNLEIDTESIYGLEEAIKDTASYVVSEMDISDISGLDDFVDSKIAEIQIESNIC